MSCCCILSWKCTDTDKAGRWRIGYKGLTFTSFWMSHFIPWSQIFIEFCMWLFHVFIIVTGFAECRSISVRVRSEDHHSSCDVYADCELTGWAETASKVFVSFFQIKHSKWTLASCFQSVGSAELTDYLALVFQIVNSSSVFFHEVEI